MHCLFNSNLNRRKRYTCTLKMLNPVVFLALSALWFVKSSSLPKLYYRLFTKRGISVSTLRQLKKLGTSSRHLSVRIKEHLSDSASNKSAVKEHIQNCSSCFQEQKEDLNSFTAIRKCNTAYEAKIQEALLIKKQNPKLNKQLYANGASFLLNIY